MSRRGRRAEFDDLWLVLPVPPSINRKYISRQFVLSKEWRMYESTVSAVCKEMGVRPIDGELEMTLRWYKENRRRDFDSPIKSIADALQGHAYENDRQIVAFREWAYQVDKDNPRIVVNVRRWEGE